MPLPSEIDGQPVTPVAEKEWDAEKATRREPMTRQQVVRECNRIIRDEMWPAQAQTGQADHEIETNRWALALQRELEKVKVAAGNHADPRVPLLRLVAMAFRCLESGGPL